MFFFLFNFFGNLFFCFDLVPIMWGIQGLQDKIKLVPIDLENRPAWYKEKVYSANKVKHYIINTFFSYLDVTRKYISSVVFPCN